MPNEAVVNETNRSSLNRANLNSLADLFRLVKIGDVLAGNTVQHLRKVNMDAAGTNAGNVSTVDVYVLPDNGKCAHILGAYARAGGVTGPLTPAVKHVTPTTGQISVAANGNIVTLGTDAITNLDVIYATEGGVVVESYFPVVSNTLTLPSALTSLGVILLAECEAVEGTATGKKIVDIAATAPAAGHAALDAAKATVAFQATDAVTRARVKLIVAPPTAAQLHKLLETSSQAI